MCVGGGICAPECNCLKRPQEGIISLVLELNDNLTWVLETELKSTASTIYISIYWVIFQPHHVNSYRTCLLFLQFKNQCFFKIVDTILMLEVQEMAQRLKVLHALPEDKSSVPRTHTDWLKMPLTSPSWAQQPLLASEGSRTVAYTQTHTHAHK